MLFEKISYNDDFPIRVKIANITEDPIHYHQDIEFVYVLKGELKLKNGYCNYTLKAGDLFTNVGHEVHALYSTGKDNSVAVIQISTRYFSKYFPELSKSCYRTYSNRPSDEKLDNLKKQILQILLQYCKRSINYKNDCIYAMVNVVDYLEKYFNLFGFKDSLVINYGTDNLINNSRISKIISYIYQYHANKITLDDLAEMEHLSTFYLSHLIKECTGMSFRDFLSFARVEWSEIYLLDGDDKISSIAKRVGFSTTAYYEKYFARWFSMSPAEYREKYRPYVKSDTRNELYMLLPTGKSISLLKSKLSKYTSQENSDSLVSTLKLDINVDCYEKPIFEADYSLTVLLTLSDMRSMGASLYSTLEELLPKSLRIISSPGDDEKALSQLKEHLLYITDNVDILTENSVISGINSTGIFARDSIAYPIYVLSSILTDDNKQVIVRLRDRENDSSEILTGDSGIITSNLIKKPSYYVYKALSLLTGDVIAWGKQYSVFRRHSGEQDCYIIVTTNYSDDIISLCGHETTPHEVNDKLAEYKDEIDFSYRLNLPEGRFCILEYTQTRENNIFNYFADMNFPKYAGFSNRLGIIDTSPSFQMYIEEVITNFNINHSIKGPGIQVSVIYPIE